MHATPPNTAKAATRKARWPVKSDYVSLHAAVVKSLIDEFAAIHGLECMRSIGNFRHVTVMRTSTMDPVDKREALRFIIDTVNASTGDRRTQELGARLQVYFGPLDRSIAVLLDRWPFVIQPAVAMN